MTTTRLLLKYGRLKLDINCDGSGGAKKNSMRRHWSVHDWRHWNSTR